MRNGWKVAASALGLIVAAGAAPALSSVNDASQNLSLREKAGQLVMFAPRGAYLSSTEKDLIRRNHLGGVIIFSGNYQNRSQLETLTRQIQRAARSGNQFKIGALISVDQEGGIVKRFPDMPPDYSAPEIGAAEGTWLAWDQGRDTGRALHSAGVNVDLAPVADLDLPPNHVMRSRSFGSRPQRVGRLVRSFSRGLQGQRTAATAKHFPGLGGATRNSDDGRAQVYRTRWELHHVDVVPFRTAIAGGIKLIMLSHALYPNDGGSRPASLNHYIATERLRRQLGFEGVAISDALNAVAWRFGGSTARACRATIKAGVDIALITGDAYAARDCAEEIVRGVNSGSISLRRLDQAVTRVLELKEWLGRFNPGAAG
jgi:beta-N-acetylhexosaminidase